MEVFVDPINPKRGFDTIQLVENKDKVTNLHINNLEKDWSFLNEYTSLKSINLRNCIIDSDDFFDQLLCPNFPGIGIPTKCKVIRIST